MSGDYTRFTFDPIKGFSGMRQQQGRVGLDAEFNEFEAILDRRSRAETYDILSDPPGTSGRAIVPRTTPTGFQVGLDAANNLTIGPGRAYVDGILVECFGDLTLTAQKTIDAIIGGDQTTAFLPYANQPFIYAPTFYTPNFPALSTNPADVDLVYLDVWPREVTVYEDASLLEPALEGPDTATRIQTAWQVKVMLGNAATTCDNPPQPDWDNLTAPTKVRLTVDTGPAPAPATGACVINPTGGYTGIENRLYRVEIQTTGTLGPPPAGKLRAQFKWSRDNASLTARVESITPVSATESAIKVSSTGRDSWMRFEDGDHIELIDDDLEFAMRETGRGGLMMKIIAPVDHSSGTISVAPADVANFFVNPDKHPRIRRWDAVDPPNDPILTDVANATAFKLEEGISITFDGADADVLHAGDYWVFSARTAEGNIVPELKKALPHGPLHHFARLGLATVGPAGTAPVIDDCRKPRPPDVINLLYVGGDGQSASAGAPLGAPLEVRIVNGSEPVQGAKVQFATLPNNGTLPNNNQPYLATTDPQGLANCSPWTLDPNTPNQVCTATLLDDKGSPIANQVVHFNASILIAPEQDECCITVGPKDDLQNVLDDAAQANPASLCICLLPGKYSLTSIPPFKSLTISGRRGLSQDATSTSTIIAAPLTFKPAKDGDPDLGTFALNDLELIGKEHSVLTVSNTERLLIKGCLLQLQTAVTTDTVLTIGQGVGEARILDCDIVCQGVAREIADLFEGKLADMVHSLAQGDEEAAKTAATNFTEMAPTARKGLATRTANIADDIAPQLDAEDAAPISEFVNVVKAQTENPQPEALVAAAAAIAPIKTSPVYGVAVNFLDGGPMAWLERNVVTGSILLYGSYTKEIFDKAQAMKGHLAGPPDTGELRMADNTLQKIVAGEIGRETSAIVQKKVFRRMVLDSNTLQMAPNEVIASSVALASNLFQAEEVLGYIVADTVTVAGNTSERQGTILRVAANDEADVANVRLQVTPI